MVEVTHRTGTFVPETTLPTSINRGSPLLSKSQMAPPATSNTITVRVHYDSPGNSTGATLGLNVWAIGSAGTPGPTSVNVAVTCNGETHDVTYALLAGGNGQFVYFANPVPAFLQCGATARVHGPGGTTTTNFLWVEYGQAASAGAHTDVSSINGVFVNSLIPFVAVVSAIAQPTTTTQATTTSATTAATTSTTAATTTTSTTLAGGATTTTSTVAGITTTTQSNYVAPGANTSATATTKPGTAVVTTTTISGGTTTTSTTTPGGATTTTIKPGASLLTDPGVGSNSIKKPAGATTTTLSGGAAAIIKLPATVKASTKKQVYKNVTKCSTVKVKGKNKRACRTVRVRIS